MTVQGGDRGQDVPSDFLDLEISFFHLTLIFPVPVMAESTDPLAPKVSR